MLRVIFALVIGVVVGVGIGFFLFQGAGDAESARVGDSHAQGARPSLGAAPDALPRGDAARSDAAVPLTEEATSVVDSTVREVAAPDAESGTGVIDGAVVDAEGGPLQGAVVRASRRLENDEDAKDSGSGLPQDPSLDESLKKQARQILLERASRHEATTGSDGRYRIEGLAPGHYSVVAFAKDRVLRARAGGAGDVEPGATVNFRALAIVDVPVAVLLPDGRAATRARMTVETINVQERSFDNRPWSAALPRLRLSDGSYRIQAIVDERLLEANGVAQELAAPKQDVTIEHGQPPAPLTFRLEARLGIRGRVVFPDDEHVENLTVHLMQAPSRGDPDLGALATADKSNWVGNWSPRFEFLDLAAGKWVVGIARGWNDPIAASAIVEVRDKIELTTLELPPLAVKDALVVRVLDVKGRPVRDVRFMLQSDMRIEWLSDGGSTERKPGEYLIAANESLAKWMAGSAEDAAKHAMTLIAESEEFGSASVVLTPGQREITITFGEPARLYVTIANYTGSGMEGRLGASLSSDSANRQFYYRGNNDEFGPDGTVKIGPQSTGKKTLNVWSRDVRPEGYMSQTNLITMPVELVAGDNRVTVSLPPTYALTVHIEGSGTPRANLQRKDPPDSTSARVVNGVAQFQTLIAGDYTLVVSGSGHDGQMRVRIPGQAEITFAPETQNALRVRVTDQKGLLASWGLADGDVVVAIDGVEFTDEASVRRLYYGAFDRDKIQATVLRSGKSIQVEMNGKDLSRQQELGGSLSPSAR